MPKALVMRLNEEINKALVSQSATPVHLGSSTHVWDAVVTDEASGRKIALFRCTQMILREQR